jgi:hypothetical protein
MLVAAAVCPHPPLLVPAVSVTAPPWLDELRAICQGSVGRLISAGVDRVVAVGSGPVTGTWDHSAGGSLVGFGVDAEAGGPDVVLPLSLTLAAWLLDEARWDGPRSYAALARAASAAECAATGAALVAGELRVGMLVMGDGSAKRSTEAPGYLDERAAGFDAEVVRALSDRDVDALMGLDPTTADDLWAAGVPAWQALAGAAQHIDRSITSAVHYDQAPRGVGYFVVDWA